MERKQITGFVITALFSALIAAGAFIRIPFYPVPITLQTLFALLAGTLLPIPMAIASVTVYLILGAIGLPIFTTGGGLAALLGPTGGYLIGMLPSVAIGGLLMRVLASKPRLAAAVSSIVATAAIYAVGIPWLASAMDIGIAPALASGFLPFVIGDTLKIIVTVIITPSLRIRVGEMLG